MIGIKKSSLYYRIKGQQDWMFPELMKLSEMADGDLDIEYCGELYRVIVHKRNSK